MTCTRYNCTRRVHAQGLCKSHYDKVLYENPRVAKLHPPALIDAPEPGWEQSAACRGTDDPDAWFPEGASASPVSDHVLETCGSCAVRASCLAASFELPDAQGVHGWWGGLSWGQRKKLKKQWLMLRQPPNSNPQRVHEPLKPCGTHAAYRRHRNRGEQACEACLEAHRRYVTPVRTRPVGRAS